MKPSSQDDFGRVRLRGKGGRVYEVAGRDGHAWASIVEEEMEKNVHVGSGAGREDVVAARTARDATLGVPRPILPSIPVDMGAGHMPPAGDNGSVSLETPVNGI